MEGPTKFGDRVLAWLSGYTIKMKRLIVACLIALAPLAAHAQPDRPIRFLLGFPAGAASDTLTRMLAEQLRAGLNQQVVVENRVGASGRLAAETLKAAPPDGATLLLSPVANVAIFPHTYTALRYDPFADFAPVSHIASFQIGYAIANNVPAKTTAEYVALVKREPKYGSFGSASAGSIPHFFGVLFGRNAGMELTHIPYKGSGPVLNDLAGGQISGASLGIADLAPLARAGRFQVLATSGAKRSAALPEVATFREQGFPIEGHGWFAVYARAGSPAALIDRYSKILADATKSKAFVDWFAKTGLEGTGTTAAELAKIHRDDYERWGPVIRASGFKSDDQ